MKKKIKISSANIKEIAQSLVCGVAVGVVYLSSTGSTVNTNGLVRGVSREAIQVYHLDPQGVFAVTTIPINKITALRVLNVTCDT